MIFKIFIKVLNNRAIGVVDKIIAPVQTSFIRGRYILDGVIVLHEVLHEVHRKKESVVFFKVDFEKAYDKINWDFLYFVMEKKGFPSKYIGWVKQTVERGKVAVMVNDQIGPFFETKKGLRQGDPFSPILFNIAIDVLNLLLLKAQDLGLVQGLVQNLIPNGISMLQYADDTIFMFRDNLESARNLKLI